MARFDVHQFSMRNSPVLAVVDVQADILASLATRMVIPPVPAALASAEELVRLKPRIDINGEPFILATTDMAAMPAEALGPLILNIEDQRHIVIDAIDFLLQGF
ncbi:MAG: CcdB family protein [Pseudorhodoplanes sp.]